MLDPSLTSIPHPYPERRERLARFVKEQGLRGYLVTNPTNVRYLTSFTGDSTYLLINNQFNLLISDGRYSQQLREECPGLAAYIRPPGQKLHEAAIEQLKCTGWSNVGVESANLTVAEFELLRSGCTTIQWKAIADGVEQFRMIKDESEVLAIQKSIDVAEKAYLRFRQYLRPTDNEIGLHHRFEMLIRDGGAEKGGFPAIIGVGPRAALPHAPPTKLAVGDHELILLDWGARCDGYISDLTRTLPLHKNITSRLKPIYDAVLAAQQAASQAIKPGIPGSAIDVAARTAIEARGFTPYTHGLGHGIGLDVHEGPQMRLGVETILQPGMVVTIEPGIYLPEWGGVRIEDNYLITPGGAQVLSTLPSDFDSVVVKW